MDIWDVALFVITRVSEVESAPPANLNLRGTVLLPDGKPAQDLLFLTTWMLVSLQYGSRLQRMLTDIFEFSDSGGEYFLFEDPKYRP